MMLFRVFALILLSSLSVHAADPSCADGTCASESDDMSVLQMNKDSKRLQKHRTEDFKVKAGKCEWYFKATAKCDLVVRRRTSDDTKNICDTADRKGWSDAKKKACTANFGPVAEGDIPEEPYVESFDQDFVLGGFTAKGASGGPADKDEDGNWQCMEEKMYNWLDSEDCTAALPAKNKMHPDDVKVHKACWSCAWVMWYKKEHCACCDPDKLIGDINGEECCDGIDMACGINGHDRRDGTPRGREVCDDAHTLQSAGVCKQLADPKPTYSASEAYVEGKTEQAYTHNWDAYKRWLEWNPADDMCKTYRKGMCEAMDQCTWDGKACKGSGKLDDGDTDVTPDDPAKACPKIDDADFCGLTERCKWEGGACVHDPNGKVAEGSEWDGA